MSVADSTVKITQSHRVVAAESPRQVEQSYHSKLALPVQPVKRVKDHTVGHTFTQVSQPPLKTIERQGRVLTQNLR